jgi:hypothetical protein
LRGKVTSRTLVYLSYGRRRAYALELTCAVASAVRFIRQQPSDLRLLVVTDEQGRRDDLPVEHLFFDDQMFLEWTEGGRYTHAAKIGALRYALDHCGGSVALVDTDTYFTDHPDRLFDLVGRGHSVMHASEQPIGDQPSWQPLLDRAPSIVAGFQVNRRSAMNNSGVIGLHEANGDLLQQCLNMMNALYAISPVFSIEQFAVTSVLSEATSVSTVADFVTHYWGIERRFIHGMLAERLPELTSATFEALVTDFPAFGLPRKRIIDQLVARGRAVAGRWSPGYRFAYLAYLCALSATTPRDREAWAGTAADMLAGEAAQPLRVQRDFRRLVDHRPDWMSTATRDAWLSIAGYAPSGSH